MKLVLKGADYSENGIVVNYEFANLVDGYGLGTTNGKQGTVANPDRCYYSDFVPVKYDELVNKGIAVDVHVLFYSEANDDSYIGKRGTTIYSIDSIAVDGTLDIFSGTDFVDGSGNPISVSSAKYYRLNIIHSAEGVEFEAQKAD